MPPAPRGSKQSLGMRIGVAPPHLPPRHSRLSIVVSNLRHYTAGVPVANRILGAGDAILRSQTFLQIQLLLIIGQ
jgi:hypothetical protein